MTRARGHRRLAAALAVAISFVLVPAGAGTRAAGAPCKPGSGTHLGHHKLTEADFREPADVRCAYLVEDDLAGFDLGQVDLTGANLEGANLRGTDLTQATLSGAKLDGADLTDAKLGQATAEGTSFADATVAHADLGQATLTGANFASADLSHADLIQATLTNANLDGADLSHADLTQATLTDANMDHSNLSDVTFTQAVLGGATFVGAKGVAPASMILLIVAAVVLLLLLAWFIRSVARGNRPVGSAGFFLGFLGVLLVALGVHLTLGGFIGEVAGDFGPQLRETCSTGVFCTLGLRSGFTGLWAGILAFVAGAIVIGKSSR